MAKRDSNVARLARTARLGDMTDRTAEDGERRQYVEETVESLRTICDLLEDPYRKWSPPLTPKQKEAEINSVDKRLLVVLRSAADQVLTR